MSFQLLSTCNELLIYYFAGKELTTKWKNIKDKFRKCLNENNSSKSGDPAKKKQKYVYFDILQFLLPVMKERPISGNITGDENLTPTTVDSVENNTSDSDHYHRIRQRPTRTSNIQNVDTALQSDSSTKLLELLKERNDRELEDMRDEDTLFLLSLVPSLKKLSPLMKMRTKIEIMTAIENNSYVDRSNYTNSSPSYGYNTSSTNVVVPSTSRQVHSALSTVITVPSKESRGQTIITGTSSAQPLFEEVPPTTAETQPSTVFQCNDWANQLCSSEKIASPSDSQISFS